MLDRQVQCDILSRNKNFIIFSLTLNHPKLDHLIYFLIYLIIETFLIINRKKKLTT